MTSSKSTWQAPLYSNAGTLFLHTLKVKCLLVTADGKSTVILIINSNICPLKLERSKLTLLEPWINFKKFPPQKKHSYTWQKTVTLETKSHDDVCSSY